MSISSTQKVLAGLVLFLIISVVGLFGTVTFFYLQMHFCNEQTLIFQNMYEKSKNSDLYEAVRCLDYTLNYYPSGSKQQTGSKLDRVVERSRKTMMMLIISELKEKSEVDFGNSPEEWISAIPYKPIEIDQSE